MCGIAGRLRSVDVERDAAAVQRMLAAQMHRGPDGEGIWSNAAQGVVLGHRRLAIIDRTHAAQQPMTDSSGRLCIVFNGEIYNYVALRDELIARGYRFTSASDTEVLLAAYHAWGTACIDRLVGMFAFALVDLAPPVGWPQALLVRDRFGIKPLLYSRDGAGLWFASELRGMQASGAVGAALDVESMLDYLAVGAVYQPRTMLAQVQALPAGHWLAQYQDTWQQVRYWDLHEATHALREELTGLTLQDAAPRLRHLLDDATRYHLIADVPVGAFLSGGVDSTAVVGLMARHTAQPIKTFAVGFDNVPDERAFARDTARILGTQHEEVVICAADAAQLFEHVIGAIDQPSIDGTNTYIVARSARQAVTVALSGVGGDELFAGYPHFRGLSNQPHARPRWWPGERLLTTLLHRLRPNGLTWQHILRRSGTVAGLGMLRRLLRDVDAQQTMPMPWRAHFANRLAARHAPWLRADADAVQQTSYAEVQGYLVSTLLRDGDAMSMAHSLEVRPPLLHHPLAEFVYALPAALKVQGRDAKRVFTAALTDVIPQAVRTRRKMGFELPVQSWMAGPLAKRLTGLLNTHAAQQLFTTRYLQQLQEQLQQGRPPQTLWAWGLLLGWLEAGRYEIPTP